MAETENPPLDSKDWEVVSRAYEDYPILAFILAQHLDTVKVLIQHSPEGGEAAIAGLDRAIDCLFYLLFSIKWVVLRICEQWPDNLHRNLRR
jgi:hypothetical protein